MDNSGQVNINPKKRVLLTAPRAAIITAVIGAISTILSAVLTYQATVIRLPYDGGNIVVTQETVVQLIADNDAKTATIQMLESGGETIIAEEDELNAKLDAKDSTIQALQTQASDLQAQVAELNAELDTHKKSADWLNRKNAAIASANDLASQGKYIEAAGSLAIALDSIGPDADVLRLRDENAGLFVTAEIEKGDILAGQSEFSSALNGLNSAKAALSKGLGAAAADHPSWQANLDAAIDRVTKERGIDMSTLEAWKSERWTYNETGEGLADSLGNRYKQEDLLNWVIVNAQSYRYTAASASIEYHLNKSYSRITGKIVPHQYFADSAVVNLQIFADDVVIYTAPQITRKSSMISFDVPIESADYIRVYIDNLAGNSGEGKVLIMDLTLH
jgi:cell division septum initiation protein DivIVA